MLGSCSANVRQRAAAYRDGGSVSKSPDDSACRRRLQHHVAGERTGEAVGGWGNRRDPCNHQVTLDRPVGCGLERAQAWVNIMPHANKASLLCEGGIHCHVMFVACLTTGLSRGCGHHGDVGIGVIGPSWRVAHALIGGEARGCHGDRYT